MQLRNLSITMLAAIMLPVLVSKPVVGQTTNAVDNIITKTSEHFAPDSRVALFDIKAKLTDGALILKGETNLPDAKDALLDSLSTFEFEVTDEIKVLPGEELKGKTYAIVNNSVANIRSRPSHPAQLATQATLGMPLKVLKKRGSWYLVQTPDDYLSWVDHGGLHTMTKKEFEKWKTSDKIIYLDTYGYAYESASEKADKVSDLVSGSILVKSGTEGDYFRVRYPDGRTGYVSRSESRNFADWKNSVEAVENKLVETAKSMKGAPYLWGGTSAKGMDCSGFTKTIYFMNGWIIPRDASQQVHAGETIDTSDGFDNLRPGDLLFFGKEATDSTSRRVVHVGMWIGNNEFIHSSGRVRVSSVDPKAENYDEYNLNRYLETKRYLHHKQGNIIDVKDMYDI